MSSPTDSTFEVPLRWQSRFEFFAEHGPQSSSSAASHAFKTLPLGRRVRLGFNPLAFAFGPLYFFTKGMWRKGLTLLGLAVSVVAACNMVVNMSDWKVGALSLVVPAVAAMTANHAYYLHVTAGSQSWNPWEGGGSAMAAPHSVLRLEWSTVGQPPQRYASSTDRTATSLLSVCAILLGALAFGYSSLFPMATDACSGTCRDGYLLGLGYLVTWGGLGLAAATSAVGIKYSARDRRPTWPWPLLSMVLILVTTFLGAYMANLVIGAQR